MKSLPPTARRGDIMPPHNAESHIAEAIRNFRDQNFAVAQIIVGDDASTGYAPSEMAAFGSILLVVKEKWESASAARNLGVSNSSGEFIAFLDANDLCLPGRLRFQAESLANGAIIPVQHRTDCIAPHSFITTGHFGLCVRRQS